MSDTERSIGGYPKVWQLGNRYTQGVFSKPVLVQEKIDGSQISFARYDGKLYIRSKGQMIVDGTDKVLTSHSDTTMGRGGVGGQTITAEVNVRVDGMFALAVEQIARRWDMLPEGYTFRGEYLNKPKHNVLRYDRVPQGNIVIFDVHEGYDGYLSLSNALDLAAVVGFEFVPTLYEGDVTGIEQLHELLEIESFLGGPKIEGFVVKQYDVPSPFGDPIFAKYVSASFKEKHGTTWKGENPNTKDFVFDLTEQYRTESRWRKAVQHLRERGELQQDPRDIGDLLKEINDDFDVECAEEVATALWRHFGKQIKRGVSRGFPEWYKEQLALGAFDLDEAAAEDIAALSAGTAFSAVARTPS